MLNFRNNLKRKKVVYKIKKKGIYVEKGNIITLCDNVSCNYHDPPPPAPPDDDPPLKPALEPHDDDE